MSYLRGSVQRLHRDGSKQHHPMIGCRSHVCKTVQIALRLCLIFALESLLYVVVCPFDHMVVVVVMIFWLS